MDKENESQLGIIARSRAAGPQTGPVGKAFQSHESRIPISHTPRKALGDVNSLDLVQAIARKGLGKLGNSVKPKGLQSRNAQKQDHQFLKPPAPASKPPKLKLKTSSSEVVTPEVKVPDIELMHNSPETDNFEDIWAAEERPATYLKEFLDWRPAQIGEYKYTEDDPVEFDAHEEYTPIESSVFTSSEHLSLEPVNLKPEDLMLPPLEDMFEESCDLFSGLS